MKGVMRCKAPLELAVRHAVFTRQLEQLRDSAYCTPQPSQQALDAEHGALIAGAEPALHVQNQVIAQQLAASER